MLFEVHANASPESHLQDGVLNDGHILQSSHSFERAVTQPLGKPRTLLMCLNVELLLFSVPYLNSCPSILSPFLSQEPLM